MKKRPPKADIAWFENPYVVSANFHAGRTKDVQAHVLFSQFFGDFEIKPLAALSLSLGYVSEEGAVRKLRAVFRFFTNGILERTTASTKEIVKGVFTPKEVNELAEAQVEEMGFIRTLGDLPSSQIVMATNLVHDTLLSLGHHRPAAYLSKVLNVDIGAVHFRIDEARRRLKKKKS